MKTNYMSFLLHQKITKILIDLEFLIEFASASIKAYWTGGMFLWNYKPLYFIYHILSLRCDTKIIIHRNIFTWEDCLLCHYNYLCYLDDRRLEHNLREDIYLFKNAKNNSMSTIKINNCWLRIKRRNCHGLAV